MFGSNMKSTNLWDTLEMQAVSMGFKYEDYADMHSKSIEPLGQVLSERGYLLFEQIFDNSYEEYCAAQEAAGAPYKLEPLVDE